MSTQMTFESLSDDIRQYLSKGGQTDGETERRIPQFINDAERKIALDLDLQGFNEVLQFTLRAGVSTYPKPDRWRRTISMSFGDDLPGDASGEERSQIFSRSYEYVRSVWPNSTKTGKPKWYADYNDKNWVIAPTPDASYRCEVISQSIPPLLDEKNNTNWLTESASILIRPAALMAAAAFNQDAEKLAIYSADYQSVLGSIDKKELLKIVDRSATRQQA